MSLDRNVQSVGSSYSPEEELLLSLMKMVGTKFPMRFLLTLSLWTYSPDFIAALIAYSTLFVADGLSIGA